MTVPMPNYFIAAENFRTLRKLGIKGWFAESVCCHPREEMVRGDQVCLPGMLGCSFATHNMALITGTNYIRWN